MVPDNNVLEENTKAKNTAVLEPSSENKQPNKTIEPQNIKETNNEVSLTTDIQNIPVTENSLTKEENETSLKEVETDKQNLTIIPESNTNIDVATTPEEVKPKKTISVISLIFLLIVVILLLGFSIFTIYNTTNDTIANGIFIKGVDVSGLSKSSAINTLNTFISEHTSEEIVLKHNDYESSISLSQISASFDVESAVNEAYDLNRSGNILTNSLSAIKLIFSPTDIEPTFSCDEGQLSKTLEEISPNLPDTVVESSYYIEDNNLIVTKGKTGNIVNVTQMKEYVKNQINELNFKNKKLNIITTSKDPTPINLDSIYKEVHKNAKDAYFTKDPYALYPSENGVDFAISLEEAKAGLEKAYGSQEYQIPLKILYPSITTAMLGDDAFPNVLSSFSTKYSSNANRTTNLILAANKINGTILMPGETFSYNKVVGERTIAAGYKEAAIYVNGDTVDGVGGGICQIATTLYEASLYANMEIIERSNHQFVPSYIGAGLDATVVYGLTDFKFKNNRDYPIKITCSVANGSVYFEIHGLATANDYEVVITANSSKTATSINAVTYKTLKQNGQVVSSNIISRDTYKRH